MIYFPEENNINKPLKKEIEKSPAIKTLKTFFNFTEDTITKKEISIVLKEIDNNPKQYGKKAIFLLHEYNDFTEQFLWDIYSIPLTIKNIIYRVKLTNMKGKIEIGFLFPNNFLDN